MGELHLGPKDNREVVRTGVGDLVLLNLPERPTSGFCWTISSVSGTSLVAAGDDFVVQPGAGVGAGGVRSFRFQARNQGVTQLLLKLRRPWEDEDSAQDSFSVTVRVG